MKSTEIVNLVNISQLNQALARESAQLDTHIKTQSVSQNVCQVSETMDLVVVLKWELLLDVHSLTSINKGHAFHHVMPDHIQTQPAESVKLAAQTVSHACHQLSVQVAAQVSI